MVRQRGVNRLGVVVFGLLGLAAALSGCGPSDKARGQVSGKVTFADGKPLTGGNVIFWGTGNRQGSAVVKSDGAYILPDAPIGDVKVTVTPPPALAAALTPAPTTKAAAQPKKTEKKPEKPATIPKKYEDQSTTPLTFTVVKGEQTFDIKLEPDAVDDTSKHGKK